MPAFYFKTKVNAIYVLKLKQPHRPDEAFRSRFIKRSNSMILNFSFLFSLLLSLNLTFLVNTRCIFADRGKYQAKRQKTMPLARFPLAPLSYFLYTLSIQSQFGTHDHAIVRCQKMINRRRLCKVQYSEMRRPGDRTPFCETSGATRRTMRHFRANVDCKSGRALSLLKQTFA